MKSCLPDDYTKVLHLCLETDEICHGILNITVIPFVSIMLTLFMYEGCSKRIAYFYLDTANFKLAQNCSFHAIKELPMARNAKFQPM